MSDVADTAADVVISAVVVIVAEVLVAVEEYDVVDVAESPRTLFLNSMFSSLCSSPK